MITDILAPPKTELSPQRRLLSVIRGWGLIVLSFHIVASRLPEDQMWSLWPYTLLPAWLGWGLAFGGGMFILSFPSQILVRVGEWLWTTWFVKQSRHRWFALCALLSGILFWLARLRHLRWGDAYMLSVLLSYPDPEIRVIYNWQAPLTVFLHQRLWQFLADPLLGWSVERVYAAVSIGCGIIFVYLLLSFMTHLGRSRLESVLLAGWVLTTGSIQLFFGYIENYTLISVGLLTTLFLIWRAIQGEIQFIWPILAFSVTNGFHPSTVFLWPGIWLLIWLSWRRGQLPFYQALWQLLLPPLLVGIAVLALMESGGHGLSALLGEDRPGGGDGIWFVPLFETTTRWQHYTMFSTAHLLDWLNLHFLISPFGLPLIIFILGYTFYFKIPLFHNQMEKDFASVLGAMSAMYLLLTWLWNPDYGGRYDWDLFAPSAFIYTLLAGYLLVRAVPDRKLLLEGGLFILAISMLHTGAWIFANTHPLPRRK